jgi:hypothetical protein
MRLTAIAVLFLVSVSAGSAQEQYMELLRTDLNANRKAIITEVMQFDDAQAETFWKMYRDYENKRMELGDDYIGLIKQYAENYESMTNEVADEIMKGMFRHQENRLDLKKSFYKDLKKAFGATTAARFTQLDSMLDRLIDLQVTAQLPLVEQVHP